MTTLTRREIVTLLDIVTESLGTDAKFESFAGTVLWLLDDISGFEGVSAATSSRIVNNLWRSYREQKNQVRQ